MNATANGSCFSLIHPEALKIGQTVALSLILVVSLVGNSLIVLIVYKTPTLRKPINMLIANMAMSDLFYPIFLVPVRLAEGHAGSWLVGGTLGQALCKLHPFLSDVSSLVSIQSLVLITVDRFVAVVVPLRSAVLSRKLCLFFIIASWIVAMAVHSPYLVAHKLVKYPERLRCELLWQEAFEGNTYPNYLLACAIVFFYIPFVLLVILYSIILIKLKTQVHPGEQSANAEEQRTRRNRNVLKMATAIVVVFFICWIPLVSNAIIDEFSAPDNLIFSSCSFYRYFNVTYFMAHANCAINPIICLILNSNYRQALKRLVSCCAADAV
ncbi:QRFP-like peptide receptor [Porites lutea]|uniref:QRFP-like peptide receptor n=1 Tax=Porites lutea TaxID=51062 RepID=UPI003CC68ABB